MTGPGLAPAPPPGPGVRPPFVAPPTDGVRRRRWWAIGLATGAAVFCCVGGVLGLGGLVVLGNEMIRKEGQAVVQDYLTAIRDERYAVAYGLLCPREKQKSLTEFRESLESGPALTGFEVSKPITVEGEYLVPATLRLDDGSSESARFRLEQQTSSGAFKVCGRAS